MVAGSATIDQPRPNRLDITQSTERAIIDWQSFNIAPSQWTEFRQPGAGAVTLNQVMTGDPSLIAGRLTANGSIVLIDPSGVTFTKGAQVNVNSLIATPTGISNANFMAGRMKFSRPSTDRQATVVNRGRITVAQHGLAALVAPGVANSGVIEAKLGRVVVAGAETYTLDFYGDGLVSFDVGRKVTEVPIGPDGKPIKSLASNSGRIEAPGGTVLLSADAVAGIIGNVVDNSGVIDAQSIGGSVGRVTIDAGPGGGANVSGTIDVSGGKAGEKGGTATVTGQSVQLARTARINASGYSGGGTVWIGGGAHGKNPRVRDAATTIVAKGARIDASAIGSGAGGWVTVWSNRATYFAGSISARGGRLGGNGGWAETSSKDALGLTGSVSVGAPHGALGTILLDPLDLTIALRAVDEDDRFVGPGGVPVDSPDQNTDITVSAFALTRLTGDLLIEASRDLTVAATLNFKQSTGQIDFLAGRDLSVDRGVQITTAGANLLLAAAVPNDGPPYTQNPKPTTFTHYSPAGALTIDGSVDSGSGTITLAAGTGGILINGAVTSDRPFSAAANIGVELVSNGAISEGPAGSISVPVLVASTRNDAGAAITLDATGNGVDHIVLSALRATGIGAAPGAISFVDGRGFEIAQLHREGPFDKGLKDQEFGINTAADAFLTAFGSIPSATRIAAANLTVQTLYDAGGDIILSDPNNTIPGHVTLTALDTAGTTLAHGRITFYDTDGFAIDAVSNRGVGLLELGISTTGNVVLEALGPIEEVTAPGVRVAAQNLTVRTLSDAGAAILLTSPDNAIPGNVTLSALNGGGTKPAAGTIDFVDSTGFTIAALPGGGLNAQEIGVNTAVDASLTGAGTVKITGAVVVGCAFEGPCSSLSSTRGDLLIDGPITSKNLFTGENLLSLTAGGTAAGTLGNINVLAPITATGAGANLIIDAAGNIVIRGALSLDGPGSSIEMTARGTAAGTLGNINVLAPITETGAFSNLALNAAGTIAIRAPLSLNGRDSSIEMTALGTVAGTLGNIIVLEPITATGAGANLIIDAAGNIVIAISGALSLDGPGSSIEMTALGTAAGMLGNIIVLEPITETGAFSNLALDAAGTIAIRAPLSLNGRNSLTALGTVAGTLGNIDVFAPIAETGTLTLDAAGNIMIRARLSLNGRDSSIALTALGTVAGTLGNINVLAPITATGAGANLIMDAAGNIVIMISGALSLDGPGSSIEMTARGTAAGTLGNINVLAPITETGAGANLIIDAADNIAIRAPFGVDAGGSSIDMSAGGAVSQSAAGTIATALLDIASFGAVSLGSANAVAILGGSVSGAGNAFLFRNAGRNLTIEAIPPDSTNGLPGLTTKGGDVTFRLPGLTTKGGDITVLTTGGFDLTISRGEGTVPTPTPVSADGGTITLLAGGQGGLFTNLGAIDSTAAGADGNIVILADAMRLAGGTIGAGTGTVLIGPATLTEAIALGATPPPPGLQVAGRLNLTAEDLASVTAGTLQIGYRNENGTRSLIGDISIVGPLAVDTTKIRDLLLVTGGAVTEAAGASIRSTTGAPLALGILAAGPVSLPGANSVGTLAGYVDGKRFFFRNNGADLTIGALTNLTLGVKFAADSIPSSAIMTGPAPNPLSGVTTAGGNIALETTTSGDLTLAAPVDAGAGAVGLASAGTILQGSGPITAASLAIISADRVSLGAFGATPDPNHVRTLAAKVLHPGQSFVFSNDAQNLTIGTVAVVSDFGAPFVNRLTGKALPATLSGVTTNNANIGLRVTSSGDLVLMANVDAVTAGVGLESAGSIVQTAGAVTAGSLEVTAVGSVSLPDANAVSVLAAQVTGAGNRFLFRDDGLSLTIGTVSALLESGTGTPPNDRMLSVGTLFGVTTTGGNIALETTTSGDLTLAQNIDAGGGSVALVSADNAAEAGGIVTASNLILKAAGNVFFGITETGGTVTLGLPNHVGTLAGRAGGIFGFLNGPALTIGTVPAILAVAGQSGIAASPGKTGDVLIETSDTGQPLTLAANLTAGGRVLLDTAGGFAQLGAVAVTAPVFAVDTTGDDIARLLAAVTSPSVGAGATAFLPPASTDNPMQFADLVAPSSAVLLVAGRGMVGGTITVGQLGLSGTGGSADLFGSIAGVTGPTAALLGLRNPGAEATYLFNDCIIAGAFCVTQPSGTATQQSGGGLLVVQQPATVLTVLVTLPVLSATVNFITPELIPAKQQANPDQPVINIFDEERLCAETANPSQPEKERCPERRQR